jgi:hypothetical protein
MESDNLDIELEAIIAEEHYSNPLEDLWGDIDAVISNQFFGMHINNSGHYECYCCHAYIGNNYETLRFLPPAKHNYPCQLAWLVDKLLTLGDMIS